MRPSRNIAPGKVWTNYRGGGLCLARAIPALSSAPCRASVTLSKYITAPALGDAIRGRASPVYRFPHFPAAAAPLAVHFIAMSAPYRRGQGAMISALAIKRRGEALAGRYSLTAPAGSVLLSKYIGLAPGLPPARARKGQGATAIVKCIIS